MAAALGALGGPLQGNAEGRPGDGQAAGVPQDGRPAPPGFCAVHAEALWQVRAQMQSTAGQALL